MKRPDQDKSRSISPERRRMFVIEMLRQKMMADSSISGATLIMPGEGAIYVSRASLMRRPERHDG